MKKKRILVVLMTLLVFVLNFQLSFASESDASISEPDLSDPIITRAIDKSENIEIGSKRTLSFKQNKPVEVDLIKKNPPTIEVLTEEIVKDKEVIFMMDTSRVVVPEEEEESKPFDYALFAGSDEKGLTLTGDVFVLKGNCHSNNDTKLDVGAVEKDGKKSEIDGILRSVGKYVPNGSGVKVTATKDGVEKIDMQDLSSNFNKTKAIRFSEALSTSSVELFYKRYVDKDDYLFEDYGGVYDPITNVDNRIRVSYNKDQKSWVLTGGTLKLNKDKPYFFSGSVQISVKGIEGNGTIVATGDINIDPGNLGESDIGLYSIHGGIVCNLAPGGIFTGLVYAPGTPKTEFEGGWLEPGSIAIRSDDFEFHGSIVGKSLDLGGNKVIEYEKTSIHDDFSNPEKDNEHLNQTKEKVIEMINNLAVNKKANVKTATIVYSDHAEVIGSEFKTISKGKVELDDTEKGIVEEYKTKIGDITEKDGCNMGDGLRLAYHLFDNGKDAEKYLIVFSNNAPDKYSVITGTDDFRIDDGVEIKEADIVNSVREDKTKASEYAKTLGTMMNSKYKGIYLVDVKLGNEHVSVLSDIGKAAGAKEVGEYYCFNPEADIATGKSYFNSLNDVVSTICSEVFVPDITTVKVGEIENPVPDTIFNYNDVKVKFGIVEKNDEGEIANTYLNKLPEGVQFISSSDLKTDGSGTLDFVDGFNSKVKPEFVYEGKTPTKVTAIIPELKADIKFNKTGEVKFELSKLVYVFTNTEDPTQDPLEVQVDIEELEINVGWTIDIN